MALQVSDQVALLPQTSSVPALSVAQAKGALLALGEEADEERRRRAPVLRRYSMWISLAVALAGAAVPLIGVLRSQQAEKRRAFVRPGAAPAGFSLGFLVRLLRPALPFILRYFAQRRQAKAASAAHNGREHRWAHR